MKWRTSVRARLAAERFGTEHHDITFSSAEFRDLLPKYVWHMEEPVCEPPAIALYHVAKLAREASVKVLLSGEGGDEAFGGYETYRNILLLERLKRILGPQGLAAGRPRSAGIARMAKCRPLRHIVAPHFRTTTGAALPWPLRSSLAKETLYTSHFRPGLAWQTVRNISLFVSVAK